MKVLLPTLVVLALALAGCTTPEESDDNGGRAGGSREVNGEVTVVGDDTNDTNEGNVTTNETNES